MFFFFFFLLDELLLKVGMCKLASVAHLEEKEKLFQLGLCQPYNSDFLVRGTHSPDCPSQFPNE